MQVVFFLLLWGIIKEIDLSHNQSTEFTDSIKNYGYQAELDTTKIYWLKLCELQNQKSVKLLNDGNKSIGLSFYLLPSGIVLQRKCELLRDVQLQCSRHFGILSVS